MRGSANPRYGIVALAMASSPSRRLRSPCNYALLRRHHAGRELLAGEHAVAVGVELGEEVLLAARGDVHGGRGGDGGRLGVHGLGVHGLRGLHHRTGGSLCGVGHGRSLRRGVGRRRDHGRGRERRDLTGDLRDLVLGDLDDLLDRLDLRDVDNLLDRLHLLPDHLLHDLLHLDHRDVLDDLADLHLRHLNDPLLVLDHRDLDDLLHRLHADLGHMLDNLLHLNLLHVLDDLLDTDLGHLNDLLHAADLRDLDDLLHGLDLETLHLANMLLDLRDHDMLDDLLHLHLDHLHDPLLVDHLRDLNDLLHGLDLDLRDLPHDLADLARHDEGGGRLHERAGVQRRAGGRHVPRLELLASRDVDGRGRDGRRGRRHGHHGRLGHHVLDGLRLHGHAPGVAHVDGSGRLNRLATAHGRLELRPGDLAVAVGIDGVEPGAALRRHLLRRLATAAHHERLALLGGLVLKVVRVLRLGLDAASLLGLLLILALHHEDVEAAEDDEQSDQGGERPEGPVAVLSGSGRVLASARRRGRRVCADLGGAVVLDVLALDEGRVGHRATRGQGVLDLLRGVRAVHRAHDGPVDLAAGGVRELPVLAADVGVAPRLAAVDAGLLVGAHLEPPADAVEVEHLLAGEGLQDVHITVQEALRPDDIRGRGRLGLVAVHAEAQPALRDVPVLDELPDGTPRVAPAELLALGLCRQGLLLLQRSASARPAIGVSVVDGLGFPAVGRMLVSIVRPRVRGPGPQPRRLGTAGPGRVALGAGCRRPRRRRQLADSAEVVGEGVAGEGGLHLRAGQQEEGPVLPRHDFLRVGRGRDQGEDCLPTLSTA
mmetsp:Transcript_8731/g.25744  ORF Transcript_8731/g.25744 Transcript_8731/m.25744 type:complete len:824 (+) Transcript_8731:108-2579(+)